jgi:hypothetical protein
VKTSKLLLSPPILAGCGVLGHSHRKIFELKKAYNR